MSINVYGVPNFLSICNPDIVFFFFIVTIVHMKTMVRSTTQYSDSLFEVLTFKAHLLSVSSSFVSVISL